MTRRFLCAFALALAGWLASPVALQADTAAIALAKSAVLEGNVAYLQVSEVGKNWRRKSARRRARWRFPTNRGDGPGFAVCGRR